MKFFLNNIKYKNILLSLLGVLLFLALVALLANTFLNRKLDKSNISLNNFSASIGEIISNNFNGLDVDIDSIELTKLKDNKIYLSIKNISIKDQFGREIINSPIAYIENGLTSYLLGSLSKLYLEQITQRSIILIRPNISFFQEENGKFDILKNAKNDDEDVSIDQNTNFINSFEENANYHFYQPYLQQLYSLVSSSENSFYNKYLKSIKALDIRDASIVVIDNNHEEIFRIDNAALNFNKKDSAVSINLNIKTEFTKNDDWYANINLLNNIDLNHVNVDLTFKNISNKTKEFNYLNFLNSIQVPLSGRVNFDITELGMIGSLRSDINIGSGDQLLDSSKLKDYKFNVIDKIFIKDGYLSFEYNSSSSEIKISEISIDYDKFIINGAGQLTLDFNRKGSLVALNFLLDRLQVEDSEFEEINSILLSEGILKGKVNFQPLIVNIESFDSSFFDGLVSLSADYYHEKKEKLSLFLDIKDGDISDIYDLWPKNYNKEARKWFMHNVKNATIVSSKLSLISKDMQEFNVGLELDFIGANISYYKDLPNLSNSSGRLSIKESQLNLSINNADIKMYEGGILKIEDSKFNILNLFKEKVGNFDLNIHGEIKDSINYLSKLGFGADKFTPLVGDNVNGKSMIRAQFEIPFATRESYDDININAKINIRDLMVKVPDNAPLPFSVDSISSPDLEIEINNNNLSMSSDAFVNGVLAKVDVNFNIYNNDGQGNFLVYAELSPTDLETFGINTEPYHSGFGRAPVWLQIITKGNSLEEIKITSDLSMFELRFPGIDWVKHPGDTANLEVTYGKESFINNEKKARIRFATDKESIEAFVKHDISKIKEFNILNFDNKNFKNIQVIGNFDSERILSLDVSGKSFDLSSIIDKTLFSTSVSKSITSSPIININIINVENIVGKRSSVQNVTGNIILQNGKLFQTDLSGYFNEDDKIDFIYTDQDDVFPIDLGINTNNAGEFFKFIGVYTKALSGSMQLRAQGPAINNLTGKLFINDFNISGDTTLLSLFAASGPSPELSSIEQVGFKKLDIDFSLTNGSIFVDQSLLDGPNVRMSFSGPVNQETGFFKISGNYCPAYEVNASFGTIPLFGPLLSGGDDQCLFAVPFVIMRDKYGEGTLVKHNAAGLLAPGVFRQFFAY